MFNTIVFPRRLSTRLAVMARRTGQRLFGEDEPAETLVAVDVGSSRVACVLAEVQNGRPKVLAAESVPSYGIRNGEIVDLARAAEAIRLAVSSAGQNAEADVRSAVVGFSGEVRFTLSRGAMEFEQATHAISEADVARLRKSIHPDCGPGYRAVHRFDGAFQAGELPGSERPVGLVAKSLSTAAGFLTAPGHRLTNLLRAVRLAGVEVEAAVLEPLGASLGGLTEDERVLGVAVLDLGAGGFRGALWEGGRLRQICACGQERTPQGVASGGMESIVVSLARRFRIAPDTARRLLREHAALGDGAKSKPPVRLPALDGLNSVEVDLAELAQVLEELLTPVVRGLRDGLSEFSASHAGGVVLVGRGAELDGLADLVARHFGGAPVRRGVPHWELAAGLRLPEALSGPAGCALCGLLRYGADLRARYRREMAATWWGRLCLRWQRLAARI